MSAQEERTERDRLALGSSGWRTSALELGHSTLDGHSGLHHSLHWRQRSRAPLEDRIVEPLPPGELARRRDEA